MVMCALTPISVSAEGEGGGGTNCSSVTFFGLDPWYSALTCTNGEIDQSNFQGSNLTSSIIRIIGVVVKDALFLAGFVAVGFVMYGGFLMVTSSGNPTAVVKAKKTISNALIGLVISILATAIATAVMNVVINGSIS